MTDSNLTRAHSLIADEPLTPLKIFVNYRVADTGGYAWALYFKLERRFGARNVFFDKASLRPGMLWFDEIKAQAAGVGVFLAVIGPGWTTSVIDHMQSETEDYVLKEISRALRYGPDVKVIPLLVNTTLPESRRLPPALRPLPDLQGARIAHETFAADVDHLIRRLDELAAQSTGPRDPADAQPGPAPDR